MQKLKTVIVKNKCVILIVGFLIAVLFVLVYCVNTYKQGDIVYIEGVKIVYRGDLTEEQKTEYEHWLEYAFERLPESLYKRFSKERCIYIMDSKNFNEAYRKTGSQNDAVAFLALDKDENPMNIYINGDRILNQDCGMPATVCHEFGHYMDYAYGKISDSDKWNEISTAEAMNQIWHQEYYEAPVEFFAQIFATYCIGNSAANSLPSFNKIKCPMAWEYMDTLIMKCEEDGE